MYARAAAPKPEDALPPPPPPAPPDVSRSPPRRQKPRPVIYKSSALQRAAPSLVAAAAPATISSSQAIKRASAAAERVRDEFKHAKCGPEIDVGEGDDEATNAKKYERRLLMNRHSAAASRVRREAYTKALEAQVVQQEATLAAYTRMLERERATINRMLADRDHDDAMDHSDVDSNEPDDQLHLPNQGEHDHHIENDNDNHNPYTPTSDHGQAVEDDYEAVDANVQSALTPSSPFARHQQPLQNPANFPVPESQTEDNVSTAAADPPQQTAQLPNLDHVPIHLGGALPSLKPEDLLLADAAVPIPTEMVPMCPDDRLLESFLFVSHPVDPKDDLPLGPLDFV